MLNIKNKPWRVSGQRRFPIIRIGILAAFILFPGSILAGEPSIVAGNNNAVEQTFCNVIMLMTGTTGKAVATVGIIGLGVGGLFGKVSWNSAMLSILSIGLIFGAASIVGDLGGGAGFALILGASPSTEESGNANGNGPNNNHEPQADANSNGNGNNNGNGHQTLPNEVEEASTLNGSCTAGSLVNQ